MGRRAEKSQGLNLFTITHANAASRGIRMRERRKYNLFMKSVANSKWKSSSPLPIPLPLL